MFCLRSFALVGVCLHVGLNAESLEGACSKGVECSKKGSQALGFVQTRAMGGKSNLIEKAEDDNGKASSEDIETKVAGEKETSGDLAGGHCRISDIDPNAFKINKGFIDKHRPKDVSHLEDWSFGLAIAGQLAGGAGGIAGARSPSQGAAAEAANALTETNAIIAGGVNKTEKFAFVAGAVAVGTALSMASSSLSYAANKQKGGDPYAAVEELSSHVEKNFAQLTKQVNAKNQALAACVNAAESRLNARINREIATLNRKIDGGWNSFFSSKKTEIQGDWVAKRKKIFIDLAHIAKLSNLNTAHEALLQIVDSHQCRGSIGVYAEEMKKWNVKTNAYERAKAYAHFDQIAQSKDLNNLCYTAALAAYVAYKNAYDKGQAHTFAHPLDYVLAKAKVMLENWRVYFYQLQHHVVRMPDGWDAQKVAKHEWLLAQDKQKHMEYMYMFAKYNRLNSNKRWYPDRAEPKGYSCRGWQLGDVSTRGMCRRCRLISGRPGCEEFRRVAGWRYNLAPGEWKHGTNWLIASFETCVRGGHVWLPGGDTKNCNFYKNDRLQHSWNSWQNPGE